MMLGVVVRVVVRVAVRATVRWVVRVLVGVVGWCHGAPRVTTTASIAATADHQW